MKIGINLYKFVYDFKFFDWIKKSKPEQVDDTFERYARYREWNKTHDCYKILYAPDGRDEKGNKIK